MIETKYETSDIQIHFLRFIGCVAVTTSMKALTFDTRSAIAKECINRVRPIDKRIKTE